VALRIAPEAVDPDDVEMLQDLVIAAVNEALRKADEMASEAMSKVAGPMGAKFPGF
jgi:DNA-binding protein YbaB